MPIFRFHPSFGGNNISSNPIAVTRSLISTSQSFGIIGSGLVYIVDTSGFGGLQLVGVVPTADGAFDAAACEQNAQLFAVATGDGVHIFSEQQAATAVTGAAGAPVVPMASSYEHRAEVVGVRFNYFYKDMFATCSWDGTIKLFSPNDLSPTAYPPGRAGMAASAVRSRNTLVATNSSGVLGAMAGNPMFNRPQVYDISWSPQSGNIIAAASADGAVRVFDIRTANSMGGLSSRASIVIPSAHSNQIVLSCHFNYYQPALLATSGTDNFAKVWDLRRVPRGDSSGGLDTTSMSSMQATAGALGGACTPLLNLVGHQAPVRRVRFSPHCRTHLLTAGYDFRCCYWDMERASSGARTNPLLFRHDHHREFVNGIDFSLLPPQGAGGGFGTVSSVSWDGSAAFWNAGQAVVPSAAQPLPPPPPPPPKLRRQELDVLRRQQPFLAGAGGRGRGPPIPVGGKPVLPPR